LQAAHAGGRSNRNTTINPDVLPWRVKSPVPREDALKPSLALTADGLGFVLPSHAASLLLYSFGRKSRLIFGAKRRKMQALVGLPKVYVFFDRLFRLTVLRFFGSAFFQKFREFQGRMQYCSARMLLRSTG
jgi:hypothetical protein